MLDTEQRFAHAVFKDADHASAAVRELMEAHFPTDAISVLMVKGPEVDELPMRHKTFVPHGIALGAVVGAAAGALALTGVGVIAAGPLLVALQGAAAGTAVGSLGGALGGLGFWRDEVDFPSTAFTSGAVLVGVVTSEERVEDASKALTDAGAPKTYVSTKAEATAKATAKQAIGGKSPQVTPT
jgi:hypothetical protein